MNKKNNSSRIIATFFLLIFFPTIFPVNLLYAGNNGPNAYDSTSFEPVDAADMVNLVSGDLSYVLPLINVPSPEGGYPLALSYHSGIAMDQEASWVGLGWSLTPGAINRNVNGHADDVEFGEENLFSFNQGVINSYQVGIGTNLYGINIGLGCHWGSNKAFGGSVTLGYGALSITSTTGGDVGVGVGYNNITYETADLQTDAAGGGVPKNSSTSQHTRTSESVGDYIVRSSSDNFNINAVLFNFSFGHARSKYTLFNQNDKNFTGALYPLGPISTTSVYNNTTRGADSNNLLVYNGGNIFNIMNSEKYYLEDNILLPATDVYTINAQGLNGAITPTFTDELPLYHSLIKADESRFSLAYYGYNEDGSPSDYNQYHYFNVPTPYTNLNHNLRLNNKFFFEFEGDNSSYLRVDRGQIVRNVNNEEAPGQFEGEEIKALVASSSQGALYNENSANGNQLKVGSRKRTGKFIESFTNKQILNGNSNTNGWFVEAKGLSRNQPATYLPESIGGFRVTDTDGKVYHYSLPVINYEIWYKNFNDVNNEDNGFFEKKQITPYATDWLLTAVTGSDYFDANGNNMVDEGDYGYWAEFEYGKWSDGYIWQSSSGDYDIVNKGSIDRQTYEYYRGRKQLYYLDAVKTRTHTAYFIKSLRDDSLGKELKVYEREWTGGEFVKSWHAKQFTDEERNYGIPPYYDAYDWDVDIFAAVEQYCSDEPNGNFSGKKKLYRYYDVPQHRSLKLDKIVLVKNKNITLNKAAGAQLVSTTNAKMFEGKSFDVTQLYLNGSQGGHPADCVHGEVSGEGSPLPVNINIHNSGNVLDVNDLAGVNLNNFAEKIITFNYDYSIMPSSPNSIANNQGKLTLKDVTFLGKKGASYLPPYKFNYRDSWVNFDAVNEDAWGYNRNDPTVWNLSEITTPLGSRINVDYEQDDYEAVAAKVSRLFNKGLVFHIWKNDPTNELFFSVTQSTDQEDNFYPDFKEVTDCFKVGEKISLDMFLCRKSRYGGHRRTVTFDLPQVEGIVTGVSNNEIVFKLPNLPDYWEKDHQDEGWLLGRKISNVAVRHLDGSNDNVIIRYGLNDRECYKWRDGFGVYENDDVAVQYNLASSNIPGKRKGGGVRVKSVSVYDNEVGAVMSSRKYYYNKFGSSHNQSSGDYISSGITSYSPAKEGQIIPFASEIPAPFVIYSNVSTEEFGRYNQLLQRTNYTFETMEPYESDASSVYRLGEHIDIAKVQDESQMGGRLNFKKYEIKSKLNYLGRLLSVKSYNANSQLISSVRNNYFESNDVQGEVGVKEESYLSKYWRYETLGSDFNTVNYVASATKTLYPSKVESVSQFNNGYTNTVHYENYDFLTGSPLDQKVVTSDGKTVMLTTTPAYKKYSGMGTKVDNIQNKNMLTQVAANYSLLYDDYYSTWGVTGVGMTRWNNSWSYKNMVGDTYTQPSNTWRKSQTFIYKGNRDENGVYQNYDMRNDQGFVWTGTSSPSLWLNTSTITLYDNYSNLLEMKDINGNYVSQKMGDNETKVMATGNARYTEMYYAGAETIDNGYWLEPEVRLDSGTRTSAYAHTGKYSVAATSATQFGVYMRSGQHRSGAYKLSVWVHKNNAAKARVRSWSSSNVYEFNGESVQAGDWVLKTHYFYDVTTADFYPFVNSVDGTTVYFDDLRIHPIASNMTSYVYNEWDELTHVIGTNNLAVKYEYDDAGRLVKTYVEVVDNPGSFFVGGFKLNSANKYNNKIMSK